MTLVLYGVAPSPFVRKVRVLLLEKNLSYELRPVTPFPPANATPDFRRMSPLGKVPALSDGDFAISDSSVICAYLDRSRPEIPLYPAEARAFARALWFEEWADSKLAEATGAVFFHRVIRPRYFQQAPDQDAVRSVLAGLLPPLLDYLEQQLGDEAWLVGGGFSIADIAVATMLQQLRHAGVAIDRARWPAVDRYADRTLARPSFAACVAEEERILAGG
jgi:glutathione S-transferase